MMAEMKQNRTLTIAGAKFWDKTLFDVLRVLTDATVKQILGELIAKIMTMSGFDGDTFNHWLSDSQKMKTMLRM